jgi:hypothetical protein
VVAESMEDSRDTKAIVVVEFEKEIFNSRKRVRGEGL